MPPRLPDELDKRQKIFVLAYVNEAKGNAYESARLAGYKGTEHEISLAAYENFNNPVVTTAIRKLRSMDAEVKTVEQQQRFLSGMIDDVTVKDSDRLRACELLCRSMGAFVERRELKVEGMQKEPYEMTDEELDEEYYRLKIKQKRRLEKHENVMRNNEATRTPETKTKT
jgi:phage terminase small subunit